MGAGKSFARVEGQCIAETLETSGLGWSKDVPQETRAAVSTFFHLSYVRDRRKCVPSTLPTAVVWTPHFPWL